MAPRTERRQWRGRKTVAGLTIAGVGVIAILAAHNVSTEPTKADRLWAQRILSEAGIGGLPPQRDFDAQRRFVSDVQSAVLELAPHRDAIPFDTTRELEDLYRHRSGFCYDRARAIEKILEVAGFETRHAALYATADHGAIGALLTPDVASHALLEVQTSRGWMAVDSNVAWLGLDHEGNPVSLADIRREKKREWHPLLQSPAWSFGESFVVVYGLFSRHGRFYPPFDPIPDVSWFQLAHNLID